MAVATIETGPDARPDTAGWVNVLFLRQLFGTELGRATVGGNQGTLWVRFNPTNPRIFQNDPSGCYAESVLAASRVIYHTMGYWHVRDEFQPHLADAGCDGAGLSEMVRYHAAIVYSRQPGNLDPDVDPSTFTFAQTETARPVVSYGVQYARMI